MVPHQTAPLPRNTLNAGWGQTRCMRTSPGMNPLAFHQTKLSAERVPPGRRSFKTPAPISLGYNLNVLTWTEISFRLCDSSFAMNLYAAWFGRICVRHIIDYSRSFRRLGVLVLRSLL